MQVETRYLSLLDSEKYNAIPRRLLGKFVSDFVRTFAYPPRNDIIPVYMVPSNRFDHLTYFFLQLFPDVTVLTYDAHPDMNLSAYKSLKKAKDVQSGILSARETKITLTIKYRKKMDGLIGMYNFMEDVLEMPNVKDSYWISKFARSVDPKGALCKRTTKKMGDDIFLFKQTLLSISKDITDLTEQVISNSKRIYVHYDPDIHPQEVIDTGFGDFGHASLEEMERSLERILFSGKLVGMTVSTHEPIVCSMVESLCEKV